MLEARTPLEAIKQEWQQMFDSMADAIMLVSRDGRIIRTNRCLAELTGLPFAALLKTDWENALKDGGFTGASEERDGTDYLHSSGLQFSLHCYPVDNIVTTGEPGSVIVLRNITEHRAIENALMASQSEWRSTFDSISDCITIHDRDFNVIRSNRVAQGMFGLGGTEEKTWKCYELFHGTPCEPEWCPARACLRTGKAEVFEAFEPHMNRFIEVRVIPRFSQDNEIVGVIHIVRDFSDHKRFEEELQEKEKKYREIFENAREGIFQCDGEGQYTNANPSFAYMFGFESPEEMIMSRQGILSRTLVEPQYEAQFHTLLKEAGMVENLETKGLRRDGSSIWLSINARRVSDKEDHLLYYEGTVVDITVRKIAEKRLSESENLYRTAIENSNDGIAILKGERHAYVNSKFLEIFGYDRPEDVIGMPFTAIVHPDEFGRVSEIIRLRQAGLPAPERYELKCMHKNGAVVYTEVSAAKTIFEEQPAALAFFRDITSRKKTDLALQKHKEILEKKNRELEAAYSELKGMQSQILQHEKMASIGQLAAGVAHEINNPVGFIMSNLNSLSKYVQRLSDFTRLTIEGLEQTEDGNGHLPLIINKIMEQKKSLKIDFILDDSINLVAESLDGTERVKRIVQNLKSFARLDSNENALADINEGLEATLNIVWNEIKYKADVKKEYGDIPPTRCNLGQLNQVFMNLLVNSAQAIEGHGEIRIRTWSDDGNICVSIGDTGCGIPKDQISKLFEPFFTTKPVGQGTGLGLSIVYDIVKKHNGSVDVESEVGKGALFTVTIPVVES